MVRERRYIYVRYALCMAAFGEIVVGFVIVFGNKNVPTIGGVLGVVLLVIEIILALFFYKLERIQSEIIETMQEIRLDLRLFLGESAMKHKKFEEDIATLNKLRKKNNDLKEDINQGKILKRIPKHEMLPIQSAPNWDEIFRKEFKSIIELSIRDLLNNKHYMERYKSRIINKKKEIEVYLDEISKKHEWVKCQIGKETVIYKIMDSANLPDCEDIDSDVKEYVFDNHMKTLRAKEKREKKERKVEKKVFVDLPSTYGGKI